MRVTPVTKSIDPDFAQTPRQRIQRELAAESKHMRKTGRCLYCDIIEGERADSGVRTVLRDDRWIAFVPPFVPFTDQVTLVFAEPPTLALNV